MSTDSDVDADVVAVDVDAAVDDDDTLSVAPEITRRTVRLLRPWRWRLAGVSLCIFAQAGLMIAGPALISYGIDQGVSKGDVDVVTTTALLFVFAALGAYVFGRAAILGVARIGEAFLLDLRDACVPPHHGSLDGVLRPYAHRSPRVAHDRRRRSAAGPPQPGPRRVPREHGAHRVHDGRDAAAELGARAEHAARHADRRRRDVVVPARVQPCLPPGARSGGRNTHRAPGGSRRGTRDPGVRPDRPHGRRVHRHESRAVRHQCAAPRRSPRST